MRPRGSLSFGLVCVLGALAAVRPAAAQPASDATIAEAREAFRVGSALAKQAEWVDALASFERSAKLKPHAVTTYNIAFCERALGHFTRARRAFQRALAAPEKELPPELSTEELGYLAEIDQRVARVTVDLARPGAALAVDGRPLEITGGSPAHPELTAGTREPGPPEPVRAASFDMLVDPGTHVVVLTTPGAPAAVLTRAFTPDEKEHITLGGAAQPPPALSTGRRTGTIVSFTAAGVGLLAGAIFGGLALKDKGALDAECMPTRSQCPKGAQGTIDTMNGFAAGSTAGFALGLAGLVAGTVIVVTGRKPSPAGGASAAVWVGAGSVGVRGTF